MTRKTLTLAGLHTWRWSFELIMWRQAKNETEKFKMMTLKRKKKQISSHFFQFIQKVEKKANEEWRFVISDDKKFEYLIEHTNELWDTYMTKHAATSIRARKKSFSLVFDVNGRSLCARVQSSLVVIFNRWFNRTSIALAFFFSCRRRFGSNRKLNYALGKSGRCWKYRNDY